jgi:outer membrane protein TolC
VGTKNALLPELNLVATVQNQGLAGQPNPFSHKYSTYEVGIQLNLRIRNRIAQADMVRDEMERRNYQVSLVQLQNRVALEIDAAVIALRRARASYQAAPRTRQLREESLDVEKARYAAGLDTAFFVIQYQSYVSQARSTEVVAEGDYFKALVGIQ